MTQGGAAQPVVVSTAAPSAGPAVPIVVVSDGRAVQGGPCQAIVQVSDGRPVLAAPPMPVVVASGAVASNVLAGPPLPVYVVSGSLSGSTLLNGLSLYLKNDEALAVPHVDSSGNVTPFTNNNTVLGVAGKIDNAASLTAASSQYLSHADAAVFRVGTQSTTWAFWANFTTLPVSGACLFSKTAVGDLSYWCDYDGTSRLRFIVTADGATPHIAVANALGAPSTATWYFVLCAYDGPNNRIGIYINGDLVGNTTAHAGGVWPGAASFKVGSRLPDEYMNGLVDEFGMWSRLLTAAEIGLLYNGGAGRTYPFVGT